MAFSPHYLIALVFSGTIKSHICNPTIQLFNNFKRNIELWRIRFRIGIFDLHTWQWSSFWSWFTCNWLLWSPWMRVTSYPWLLGTWSETVIYWWPWQLISECLLLDYLHDTWTRAKQYYYISILYLNQETRGSDFRLLLRVTLRFSWRKCINKLHMDYSNILGKKLPYHVANL